MIVRAVSRLLFSALDSQQLRDVLCISGQCSHCPLCSLPRCCNTCVVSCLRDFYGLPKDFLYISFRMNDITSFKAMACSFNHRTGGLIHRISLAASSLRRASG